jgi:hypothetical protein
MVGSGFQELDLYQDHLVIETFKLLEEGVDERKGFGVRVFLEIESHETGLEVLAEEGTSLLDGPFDARFCHGDLDVEGIRNRRKEVNELADC